MQELTLAGLAEWPAAIVNGDHPMRDRARSTLVLVRRVQPAETSTPRHPRPHAA